MKTRSMTSGTPLRLIVSFALPLLAGNIFQQTYNIADAAIVGRFLGPDALAAVGASSSVQFLVLGFCMGICSGFAVPVAQRFGAEDLHSMRKYIFNSLLLTGALAFVITAITALLCPYILRLLKTPGSIYSNAYAYLLIIFLGIPFTLLYNILSSVLRAVGDSKTPFIFLVISTVLNIFLDLLCIVVFHWGCAGAAIATIASQAVSGIICLIYMIKKSDLLKFQKNETRPDGKYARNLIIMGVPMGLQFSITAIGSMVLQAANNGLGNTAYVSGFTAAMRIKQLTMCPFDALATGVSTFASQNYGALKFKRIKKGILQGCLVGAAYGLVMGIVLIFSGRYLTLIFISSRHTAVLDASAQYLRTLGYFFWSLGFLNVCRMSAQGLGFSGRAVFSGVMEMAARITVSLVFVPIAGFSAICFADPTAWLAGMIYSCITIVLCVKKAERKAGLN